jgi:hypothetical protein
VQVQPLVFFEYNSRPKFKYRSMTDDSMGSMLADKDEAPAICHLCSDVGRLASRCNVHETGYGGDFSMPIRFSGIPIPYKFDSSTATP